MKLKPSYKIRLLVCIKWFYPNVTNIYFEILMPDNRKILWHIYETWLPWDYLNIIWTFYYNRYLLLINAPNSCNSRNINMCSNGNHILLLSSILNTLHVCIHCTTLSITTLYISVYQFLYKPDLDLFNRIFTRNIGEDILS